MDKNFAKQVVFSNEAHFYLNGIVYKQNCRIWGNENPRKMQKYKKHPLKTSVWCSFWGGGEIGTLFFKTDEGLRFLFMDYGTET